MTDISLQIRKQGGLGFWRGGEGGTTLPKPQAFSSPLTPHGKGGGVRVVLSPPSGVLCRRCGAVLQSHIVIVVSGEQSNGINSSSSLRTFSPPVIGIAAAAGLPVIVVVVKHDPHGEHILEGVSAKSKTLGTIPRNFIMPLVPDFRKIIKRKASVVLSMGMHLMAWNSDDNETALWDFGCFGRFLQMRRK